MKPTTIHEETYKGIPFQICTAEGSEPWGIFRANTPFGCARHWERYCVLDEPYTPENMRKAIDRAHAGCPVFTGDLRFRRQIEAENRYR